MIIIYSYIKSIKYAQVYFNMFINYIMCIYHKLVTPKLLYNMIRLNTKLLKTMKIINRILNVTEMLTSRKIYQVYIKYYIFCTSYKILLLQNVKKKYIIQVIINNVQAINLTVNTICQYIISKSINRYGLFWSILSYRNIDNKRLNFSTFLSCFHKY